MVFSNHCFHIIFYIFMIHLWIVQYIVSLIVRVLDNFLPYTLYPSDIFLFRTIDGCTVVVFGVNFVSHEKLSDIDNN